MNRSSAGLDRRLLGVLIAALVCSLAYFGTNLIVGSYFALKAQNYSWDGIVWLAGTWAKYPGAVGFGILIFLIVVAIIGLPLDAALRFFGWRSAAAYGAVGGVFGSGIGIALASLIPPLWGPSDMPPDLSTWGWVQHYLLHLWLFGILGCLAAVTFQAVVDGKLLSASARP